MSGARPAWLPEKLFPFQSRFLEVRGCRVHYVDEGQGPPLLMLHGNPTYSFLYRGVIAGLRDRFRCIAVDYPGFGLSTAPAGYDYKPRSHSLVVEELVARLDLRELTVMVQDWGGPIGLGMAGRVPERIRALVIGDTLAWPVDTNKTARRFSKFMGGPVGGFLIQNFNVLVNVFIPLGVKRRKIEPEVMDAYRGPFRERSKREPMHIFPRELLASGDFLAEVETGLAKLRDRPALVLWADRDVAFRASLREKFEVLFPRHQTVIIPGAGHYFPEDAPEDVVRAIRAWWPPTAS